MFSNGLSLCNLRTVKTNSIKLRVCSYACIDGLPKVLKKSVDEFYDNMQFCYVTDLAEIH